MSREASWPVIETTCCRIMRLCTTFVRESVWLCVWECLRMFISLYIACLRLHIYIYMAMYLWFCESIHMYFGMLPFVGECNIKYRYNFKMYFLIRPSYSFFNIRKETDPLKGNGLIKFKITTLLADDYVRCSSDHIPAYHSYIITYLVQRRVIQLLIGFGELLSVMM